MGLFDSFRKKQDRFLLVGLGNPGKEYEGTRHNIGFLAIDRLAKEHGISVEKWKYKAMMGEGTIHGQKVILIKPQTFMNLSGESVREVMRFYQIPPEEIAVIYDDTSLPLGSLRIREKGSAGGHNGMKHIIRQLGTESFLRIRIGIGEKPAGWDLADYVLSRFSKDEAPLVEKGVSLATEAVSLLLTKGTAEAMKTIHTQPKSQKSSEVKP